MAEAAGRSVAFAKTTRPAIGAVVNRERLFALLDGSPGRAVAWIWGPPGAGKTTLAASYLHARGLRSLWYQVDPDDADPATFFHYLDHAARKLEGAGAGAPTAPLSTPETDLASYARRFFRELFARARPPFALVLDNLHAVPADSALGTVIALAFGQIPKGCCMIVTSRAEPGPSLARLRAAGAMVLVGAEQLRVEPDELAAIARLRGLDLTAEALEGLDARTRGWAAGLVLMLEHAKLAGHIAEFPDGATPQVVFDYLAGEIFERFEPKTRRFLMQVACLPRMTGELAQELSGEPKAARILLNLALNNYFVSEVQSEEGRVFQLHPLLRDFLRGRAAQDLPEAIGAEQLQRAAAMLRAAGQAEDAIALLADARNWTEMARLAAEQADRMLAQGRSETLGGWLDLLPPEVLNGDARLTCALAACRLHASPRAARQLFERSYECFHRDGDLEGMAESCRGVIEASLRELDDLAPLDQWCRRLADLLRDLPARDRGNTRAAQAAALVHGLLWRDPGHAQLAAWLARPELAAERAAAALLAGDFPAANAAVEGLIAGGRDLPAPGAIALGAIDALRHLLAGDHEAASRAAKAGLTTAEAHGVHLHDPWLHALAAGAALSCGERDVARLELQRMGSSAAQSRRGDRALAHYLRGWLAELDGDSPGAQREAKTAAALAVETGLPWLECLARVASARIHAGAGERRACEAQLRGARGIAERLHSPLADFAVRLAAAVAENTLDDEPAALAALREAFSIGQEHGYQHVPGWRAREVADLCVLALRHEIAPQYAGGLVRARRLVPRSPPLRVAGWPWPFRVFSFGDFRLERGGDALELSGKGPGRPMELLKVLIAQGGQNVRADQLGDALWPHVDADYAHKSFTATLHRLRRLFGEDEALTLRDGRLSLNPALVWSDVRAIEQLLAEIDEGLRAPRTCDFLPGLDALLNEVFALYRGPFLPDESEQPSYIACREQVRARLLRCLSRAARLLEEAGQADAAADCYLRCIEADALFEAPYRNLMLCYRRSGDRAEAGATYERLRTVLATRLGSIPSPETQAVYAESERAPRSEA